MCAGIFVLATPSANASAGTETIFLTSGTSWTVPSDWNNAVNTIEVIGGGGGATDGNSVTPEREAAIPTIKRKLHPNSMVTVAIGGGGAGGASGPVSILPFNPGASGGDTYFCNSSSNCAAISAGAACSNSGSDSAVQVCAEGGVPELQQALVAARRREVQRVVE